MLQSTMPWMALMTSSMLLMPVMGGSGVAISMTSDRTDAAAEVPVPVFRGDPGALGRLPLLVDQRLHFQQRERILGEAGVRQKVALEVGGVDDVDAGDDRHHPFDQSDRLPPVRRARSHEGL